MIIHVEQVAKGYADRTLFKDATLTFTSGDRVGVIGVNGTGKSTLLKLIAGIESPDQGAITMPKGTNIAYLPQEPQFKADTSVIDEVFRGEARVLQTVRAYELAAYHLGQAPDNPSYIKDFNNLTEAMTAQDAWSIESMAKQILTKLGIDNFEAPIQTLSGGQQKRVALARALISDADLLILDEPTNHLDHQTVDWLEGFLSQYKGILLMITHDRYFLDRVVNKTLELDEGQFYTYSGNYEAFMTLKMERKTREQTMQEKQAKLFKQELEWIRAGVEARRTKQKARKERFYSLEAQQTNTKHEAMSIDVGHSRLGKKTITCDKVTFAYKGHAPLFTDFNFILKRNDRLGIIGQNGYGKTTLLNVLCGRVQPTSGQVDHGETVKIGYFTQQALEMPTDQRAIEFIKDIAEYVSSADGGKITASQMMERFLFNKTMQWAPIGKLSGGERRRLYLLSILMGAPNVLVLDEPTNDLDIETLTILENYLDDFGGAVMTVSHDRYFLDRVCDRILAFESPGHLIENTGNYTDYIDKATPQAQTKVQESAQPVATYEKTKKLKMTYKEEQEYKRLDQDLAACELAIEKIDHAMAACATDFVKLQGLQEEKDALEENLLYLLERQEYLEDLAQKIKEANA